MAIKFIGSIVSVLLLVQSIDNSNPIVQVLCGKDSKTNCNAILTSDAAKVFDGLSWSEVGFFYFSGSLLTSILTAGNVSSLETLAWVNLLCLPYTIYSIYYQSRVAKVWCLLCTSVQIILWTEFLAFLPSLKLGLPKMDGIHITDFLIGFSAPILIWIVLKPLLTKSHQLRSARYQLRNIKFDIDFFNGKLEEEPKYALPHPDWSIVMGNMAATNVITIVSDPYCSPCGKAHQELHEWLNRLDIQLRIVFTSMDQGNNDTLITRHLMALSQSGDKKTMQKALHDWYSQRERDYASWSKAYPVTINRDVLDVLRKQREWCDINGIDSTPTISVNGRKIPEIYKLEEVKYFV